MKVYIVQEIAEYKIYKVPDNLIAEFEAAKKECIVVEGNSIQEVIIGFDAVTKLEGLQFNSELVKYKTISKDQEENEAIKHKHRMKF
ncbi:hypothetical protein BH10BAC2_BH10BAC2_47710 [soil metagenome]